MIALHVFARIAVNAARIVQEPHGGTSEDPDRMQIHAIRGFTTSQGADGTWFSFESSPEWFRPVDPERWQCLRRVGVLHGLRGCRVLSDSTLHIHCPLEPVFRNGFDRESAATYWSSDSGSGPHWVEIRFDRPTTLGTLAIAWKGHPRAYSVSLRSKSGWMVLYRTGRPETTDILKPRGYRRAISSVQQWEERSAAVRRNILTLMHAFPEEICRPCVEVVSRKRLASGVVTEFSYRPEPWHTLHAHLALPSTGKPPYPLIVYTMYNRHMALRCAMPFLERGFAVFAPDILIDGGRIPSGHPFTLQLPFMHRLYGSAGLYRKNRSDMIIGPRKWVPRPHWDQSARWSAMGKIIWDIARGLDVVLAMPEIDPSRVGCTGYSWGGTHTQYIMAFEDRIRASSPQCTGFVSMRLSRAVGNTSATWYHLPELSRYFREDMTSRVPFDREELLALAAPRPVFIVDESREDPWVMHTFEQVRRVYRLYGAEDRFVVRSTRDAHSYYLEAVDWFSKALGLTRTARARA
jgi:dienelactone hydrolase